MMYWVLFTFALVVCVEGQGLPFCEDCGSDCRPPRDTEQGDTWQTMEQTNNATGHVTTCVCQCGKREFEACVRGQCGYGLRCLHTKHTTTAGGNICKPLCQDPSEYHPTMYSLCEEDIENDRPIILPRIVTCGELHVPTTATRMLIDGHHSELSFINPCEMSNANAQLIAEPDMGGMWQISELL